MGLAEKVIEGDIRAAARLITNIDDEMPDAVEELKKIYSKTGKAHIIGITGSPGVGKSTLVDKLIKSHRDRGLTVGVIALDPTSPFSGGAILGDRIRMQGHTVDNEVFIRSVATRGCLGGLSYTTNDIIKVMDAMGKEIIIIETVGVGQSEVEIVNSCKTSIVVLAPGLGDDVQMIKAGILEIADIFVINKADKDGADKVENDLRTMLHMNPKKEKEWTPSIFRTVANLDEGISELTDGINQHRQYLDGGEATGNQAKESIKLEFMKLLQNRVHAAVMENVSAKGLLDVIIEDLYHQRRDPYTIVEEIINQTLTGPKT